MTQEETLEETNTIQKPSIKLIHGQRGGYGWEIKILSLDVEALNKINEDMLMKYGGYSSSAS